MAFSQQQGWQGPSDDGFALRRGLFTGALAEHELEHYASTNSFSIALGDIAEKIIGNMDFGQLGVDRQQEIRAAGIRWVHQWQEQFPRQDDDLG
jgi:hypothetical protein